jgi:predicted nucleotide-binding protein
VPTKPVVFIACSHEQLKLANAIDSHLAGTAEVHIWEDDLRPKREILNGLIEEAKKSDFAIFICAPDDSVELRGGPAIFAPRDNVIFEAGLFVCELDPTRLFFLLPAGHDVRLPDDLDKREIVPLIYDSAARNERAAVRQACAQIDGMIRTLRARRPRLWDDISDAKVLRDALLSVDRMAEQ